MKKKYSVYCSKGIYGATNPFRLFYVFVNDKGKENDKSRIHIIECKDNKLCLRDMGFDNPLPPGFMRSLQYYGEVDDLYDINFEVGL